MKEIIGEKGYIFVGTVGELRQIINERKKYQGV